MKAIPLGLALGAVLFSLAACRTAPPAPPAPAAASVPAPPAPLRTRPRPRAIDARAHEETLAPFASQLLVADAPAQALPASFAQVFPERYSEVPGVLTFRGNPARTGGAWGSAAVQRKRLRVAWTFKTTEGKPPWGGGTGWTGQPVLVQWPDVVRHSMPLGKRAHGSQDFVEVIQGSLDGRVYFLDLATGEPTRPAIDTGNPIKGSVSVDPRGYPLLYVGQGIPRDKPLGLRIYSLLDQRELFFLPGKDRFAIRPWGAFDGAGVVNRHTDTLLQGGENGILYLLKLNTQFSLIPPSIHLAPEIVRFLYYNLNNEHFGIENSITVYRNLAFFADNGGTIQAMDLTRLQQLWAFETGDDTDASLTLSVEEGAPFLYTGCEVDKQGTHGFARLRKLDGLQGTQLWERAFACVGADGPPKKIDAGLFATNVVGTGEIADLVIYTLSRCPRFESGLMVALRKSDGATVWQRELDAYSWSSPTAFVGEDGHSYLLQGDIAGRLHLLEARTGKLLHTVRLHGGIESSPSVFGNMAVLGTRGQRIYGIRVE